MGQDGSDRPRCAAGPVRDERHVEPTRAYAACHAEPVWATQSRPMRVIEGALHPAIADDGTSRKVRNSVGARDAHTARFVISDTPVSFGRLARRFRNELRCPDAVFSRRRRVERVAPERGAPRLRSRARADGGRAGPAPSAAVPRATHVPRAPMPRRGRARDVCPTDGLDVRDPDRRRMARRIRPALRDRGGARVVDPPAHAPSSMVKPMTRGDRGRSGRGPDGGRRRTAPICRPHQRGYAPSPV
jgi:hypothetical protein